MKPEKRTGIKGMKGFTSSGHAAGGQHGLAMDTDHNLDKTYNPASSRGRRGTFYGTYLPTDPHLHPHVKDMLASKSETDINLSRQPINTARL